MKSTAIGVAVIHGHIDAQQSKKNRLLIGDEDWAQQAKAEIEAMKQHNHALAIARLKQRREKAALKRLLKNGPADPWRKSKHGPLREVLITANKDWFGQGLQKKAKEQAFEKRATDWLKHNFGKDVIHARADHDEAAYHIHAIIMPRVQIGEKKMLQPSVHPLISDYEKAQDSIGQQFTDIGLVRGEQTAAKRRKARSQNQTLPQKKRHTRPIKWRQQEELRLIAQKEKQDAEKRSIQKHYKHLSLVEATIQSFAMGALTINENKLKRAPKEQNNPLAPKLAQAITNDKKAALSALKTVEPWAKALQQSAENKALSQLEAGLQALQAGQKEITAIKIALPKELEARANRAKRMQQRVLDEVGRQRTKRFAEKMRG